jgi:hypothetical protein
MSRRTGRARVALLLALAIVATPAVAQSRAEIDIRREKIEAMHDSATPEALDRRARSMARMKAEGVPVSDGLPAIEDSTQAARRTREEVAHRALALLVVAVKGEGLEQPVVDDVVRKYGLTAHFTPAEAAFIRDPAPTDHDRIQFAWRYEAA